MWNHSVTQVWPRSGSILDVQVLQVGRLLLFGSGSGEGRRKCEIRVEKRRRFFDHLVCLALYETLLSEANKLKKSEGGGTGAPRCQVKKMEPATGTKDATNFASDLPSSLSTTL